MRKTIFPAALPAALLTAFLLAGCVAEQTSSRGGTGTHKPDHSVRREAEGSYYRVAARLQPGGSYYRITTPEPLFRQVRRVAGAIGHALRNSGLPEETKQQYLTWLASAELVAHLSGIGEIEGAGKSSTPAGEGGRFFDNRAFLAVPETAEGFLWRLPGKGNPVPLEELENLPGGTIAAACFEFHPEAVYRALESSESLRRHFDDALGLFGGTDNLRQLFDGTGGLWRLLLYAGEDGEPRFAFSIPDREGKVFTLLSALASSVPGAQIGENQVEFPQMRGVPFRFAPFFLHANGRLNGSGERLPMPAEGRKKLGETTEFRRLADGLPREGIGFFYTGSNYGELARQNLGKLDLNLDFDANLLKPIQLTVLRREPDGFLATGRSNWEYGQLELLENSLLPAALFAGALAPGMARQTAEAQAPEHLAECRGRLDKIGRALRKYAEFHGGAYPSQPDIDGFRELVSSGYFKPELLICPDADGDKPAPDAAHLSYDNLSYLYLEGAKFEKDSKIPVAIDWPFNHRDTFNVLFADGSVETVELENPGSCKRIIGALHSRYRYPEAEFRRLIRQAERIDKLFELE